MVSDQLFCGVYTGLLAELWRELDALRQSLPPAELGSARDRWEMRATAFLLELALCHERCDVFVIRSALRAADRQRVQELLGKVWGALVVDRAVGDAVIQESFARAQDIVFEEVHGLCAHSPSQQARKHA